jgi:predicted RNA-binding Zn-ribbon protein involved in translation (DUF1610 family)
MTIALPDILYRTKRGLCPGCGAPLAIDPDKAETSCGFCGQSAVLERRLRTIEPEIDGAPLRLYFDDQSAAAGRATSARWVRSKQYREGLIGSANCPGCGTELQYQDDATVLRCRSCGTDSRLERRLWSPPPDPATEVPRPQHPSNRFRAAEGEHPDTEHLIWRILNEPHADRRLALARRLDEWIHVNATAARLLPPLLTGTRTAEPALQYQAAQLVGKLLCQGSPALRNATVRAGERFLFDTACPRPIVFELGMGDGVCLKPLLDAAEWAVRHGDMEYACACLVGVNWIFQRNFNHHDIMGQIILYRMLYLTGPVLAFALLLAQRQVTGTGFHYRAETLLRFIDDAAVERPAIVPELDKAFYVAWPKNAGELAARLTFYRGLQTDAARASALRHYLRTPDDWSDDAFNALLAVALPLAQSPGPLRSAAEHCLAEVVSHAPASSAAIDECVRTHGRSLPVEMQRAYLMSHPKTPWLSFDGLPYWEPRKDQPLSEELARAKATWREGLRRAVDVQSGIQKQAAARREAVQELDVPIYDGVTDGPATAEESFGYDDPGPRARPPSSREARPAPGDETAPHDDSQGTPPELTPEAIAGYRQVLEQIEAMRPQMQAIGPHAVAALDEQVRQIKAMCPGL